MSLHRGVRETKTAARLVFLAALAGALAGVIGGHKWHTRGMSDPERAFFNRYISVSILQSAGLWGYQNRFGVVPDIQKAVVDFRRAWPATAAAWDRLAIQIIFYLPLGGGALAGGAVGVALLLRQKTDAQPPAAQPPAIKKPWN